MTDTEEGPVSGCTASFRWKILFRMTEQSLARRSPKTLQTTLKSRSGDCKETISVEFGESSASAAGFMENEFHFYILSKGNITLTCYFEAAECEKMFIQRDRAFFFPVFSTIGNRGNCG